MADDIVEGGWIEVWSSNVERFRYIWDQELLEVTFNPTTDKTKTGPRSGRRASYQYLGVPPAVYEAFLAADSKGQFVWQHLRDKFTTIGPY